ncbi:MAG: hypothetical protein Q8L45_13985 [Xanthomonadaceae bacterium]|jgi:hypothetical protein|nr:hypothetical protein [Xanthomonadaceae bacterium]MDP2185201.1 hypothetical protein [Xanthomonadales bacterium]MDZ4116885.1 hypothetical protein [Xanthomonadaceae bacterium]MDZ4379494.1 hypothetical protein [Xanthomonadaceae bacterium]PKM15725.1 MAG: hypothetical protein CVV12_07060 [Gammaproteobacteria bacterium HGW-Gammaproteobacteria-2]
MTNVLNFPNPSLSDDALVGRLFELAASGDALSDEFLELDAEMQRRLDRATAGEPRRLSAVSRFG